MLTPADHEDLTRRLDFLLDIDIRWDAIKKFITTSQPLLVEFTKGVKNYLMESFSDVTDKET